MMHGREKSDSDIFYVLAKGDNIPVRRMAYTASRERPEVALVLRGKEGSGKESSYARPIGLVADERLGWIIDQIEAS